MRISDWRSYVCSSDLDRGNARDGRVRRRLRRQDAAARPSDRIALTPAEIAGRGRDCFWCLPLFRSTDLRDSGPAAARGGAGQAHLYPAFRGLFRSEEHTSELQSLMRISYAVFCLKTKNTLNKSPTTH